MKPIHLWPDIFVCARARDRGFRSYDPLPPPPRPRGRLSFRHCICLSAFVSASVCRNYVALSLTCMSAYYALFLSLSFSLLPATLSLFFPPSFPTLLNSLSSLSLPPSSALFSPSLPPASFQSPLFQRRRERDRPACLPAQTLMQYLQLRGACNR